MTDYGKHKNRIKARLAELDERLNEIEDSLEKPKSKDFEDYAVEMEDHETLEGMGIAGLQETKLLQAALKRIDEGTYGTCQSCGDPISGARLEAVPYAPLCRNCANR